MVDPDTERELKKILGHFDTAHSHQDVRTYGLRGMKTFITYVMLWGVHNQKE